MDLAPARYTPWMKGVYEVAPGLRGFGTDFGNGEQDRKVFQIDREFDRYAENKRRCLRERRSKYVRAFRLSRGVELAAIEFIARRLAAEYPETYAASVSGSTVVLESEGRRWEMGASGRERESAALDFLARLIPEDFAIVRRQDGVDWFSYLHLCSPSHWAAEEKVGRSFFDAHEPIPGFERANAAAKGLVEGMISKGPFVRFVWGVESDDRLNHHPEPPPGEDPALWNGRRFAETGRFWVRTERQTTWGLPEVDAALFFIHVGFVADVDLSPDERERLRSAVESMSPEARAYKGLDAEFGALMELLKA